MNPYKYSIIGGGMQRANFWPVVGALVGGAAIGAGIAELTGGEWEEGAMYGAAGGAGLAAAGVSIPAVAGGIFEGGVGIVSSAGSALVGGQAAVPVMTGGEMGSLAQASAAGGIFSGLSLDTLANVAQAGYGVYMTGEQMKLAEKAIEAQYRAGYVVAAPGATTLAPTTAITIPAAAAAAQPAGLFGTEEQAKMVKYGVIALLAYLVLKGSK